MMRSMFSGVSGLRAHQLQMDVIGNNISNVNTVGYKSSRVTFQEVYNQTLKSATGPTATRGGTNPTQLGLGVSVGSIDVLHTRSGAQRTDKATDLSIEGEGFFVVSDGESNYYTRAGNFDIDRLGNFVTSNGLTVMGWQRNQPTSTAPRAINLSGLSMPASQTDSLTFNGNLNVDTEVDDIENYTMGFFDSLGREHKLELEFEKAATHNQWNVIFKAPEGSRYTVNEGFTPNTITFNDDGTINTGLEGQVSVNIEGINNPMTIDLDFAKITQSAGNTNLKGEQIGGYTAGTIESISIDSNGIITGLYTNGQSQEEWEIAMAHFTNPSGLTKLGNNLFQKSTNSGEADLGVAGEGGRGVLNPGSLEMSNVDLAQEFTDMIIAQRGFQANSRIITTSDEMLQELVNLKR